MFTKVWNYKKFRFLIVGIFNTAIDFTILNTMVLAFKAPVWLANTISVCIAASISYFLNHKIVFRHEKPPTIKGYLKFFSVTVVGVVVIQTVVIYLTKPIFEHIIKHMHFITAHGLSNDVTLNLAKVVAVLVGMVWNYCMYSMFVFSKKKENVPIDPVI